jgi:diaminopimelate decarboxylase
MAIWRFLKTLPKLGAGADVVSGGELFKALAAGIPAVQDVFSGVGKTRQKCAPPWKPAFISSMSKANPNWRR